MATKQAPSIGRVVHVKRYADGKNATGCLAATIALVWNPTTVNVGGFDTEGQPFSVISIEEDNGLAWSGQRWHWPEFVAAIEVDTDGD